MISKIADYMVNNYSTKRNFYALLLIGIIIIAFPVNKNKMTLNFSDGETFDTSENLRTELRKDGWYVLGNGYLIPVDTKEKGDSFIKLLKQSNKIKSNESN